MLPCPYMGLTNFFHPKKDAPGHVVMSVTEITPSIFVGTNKCCRAHYKVMLLDKGVAHDISLEGEEVDMPYGVDSYLWLPTPDHEAPTKLDLQLGTDYVNDVVYRGGKVFIHCKNGHGRSPTLVAAWLTTQGMNVDEAIEFIRSKRMEVHFETSQVDALRKFAARTK